MPEYLAPGVFVEEVSFRSKSIEGVSTSTTGFVGPTRRGPVPNADSKPLPELLTSFLDFQRVYGGMADLNFTGATADAPDKRLNYLAHAVRAYFENGGARLYVARVQSGGAKAAADVVAGANGAAFRARFEGEAGNGTLEMVLKKQRVSVAALNKSPTGTVAQAGTKVYTRNDAGKFATVAAGGGGGGAAEVIADDAANVDIVTVNAVTTDGDGQTKQYEDMGLDPAHPRFIGNVMAMKPTRRSDELEQMYALDIDPKVTARDLLDKFKEVDSKPKVFTLEGGKDGTAPTVEAYKQGLKALAAIEDISIVAAPAAAYTRAGNATDVTAYRGVTDALIGHCEARRAYRIAVLDTRQISTPDSAKEDRAPLDSKYAALYTPWIITPNPLFRPGDASQPAEIAVPPSGSICGIYARNDINRGVFKAPANEVVRGALRHDLEINFAQQEVLNPIGINCLRFFPNRGNRVWGARTISSDPEWKYVNVRRYFNYLERSIDVSTQWAVFEPNGERLWSNIRDTVSDFLVNEWRSGALLGTSTKEAFFVRCDRSTMDQNDLDNGRLVCLIGVAVVKPAEFVIFRVGQKTADART